VSKEIGGKSENDRKSNKNRKNNYKQTNAMKQIIFFIICIAVLFVACDTCGCSGEYTVDQHPCVCIKFKGKIGNDYDSALDSLKRWYEPCFQRLIAEGNYSGEGYFVEKVKINVDFTEDDRNFFRLTFTDSVSIRNHIASFDVLDEKGNYYKYIMGLLD
jgi:hypothetical protein